MQVERRSTQVGRRGAPAKGVGRVTGARVRISPSPPSRGDKKDIATESPDFIGAFAVLDSDFQESNRRSKKTVFPLRIGFSNRILVIQTDRRKNRSVFYCSEEGESMKTYTGLSHIKNLVQNALMVDIKTSVIGA